MCYDYSDLRVGYFDESIDMSSKYICAAEDIPVTL